MNSHVRANLWLLALTLLLCSFLYPLVLWLYGQAIFPYQAEGSLIDDKGEPVTDPARARGSRLIGQPFKGKEYFQLRPSFAGSGYDASASGASNWGASNPLLRSRVARQLGPIVRYAADYPHRKKKRGDLVAGEIETWFQTHADRNPKKYVSQWATDNSALAEQYVKENPEAVAKWLQANKVPKWQNRKEEDNIKEAKSNASETAKLFFATFAENQPGHWPAVDNQTEQPKREKSEDIQGYFFDLWLQDKKNRGIRLEQVPADLVMASGSGLDPHITLKNALYQLDRVAGAWASKHKRNKEKVRTEIEALLKEKAAAPLGGLVGVRMVNVLEVNLALKRQMESLDEKSE